MSSTTGICRVFSPSRTVTFLVMARLSRVLTLRLPTGRPLGLPDWPGLNSTVLWRTLIADLVAFLDGFRGDGVKLGRGRARRLGFLSGHQCACSGADASTSISGALALRSSATSSKLRSVPASVADFPVKVCHRRTATST